MPDGVTGWDPELGPIVAIPEPFWERSWRTRFRWRPQCAACIAIGFHGGETGKPAPAPWYASRAEYETHWLRFHHIEDVQ